MEYSTFPNRKAHEAAIIRFMGFVGCLPVYYGSKVGRA
jgi:hypothetical protein